MVVIDSKKNFNKRATSIMSLFSNDQTISKRIES
jgi:hypothetical protein